MMLLYKNLLALVLSIGPGIVFGPLVFLSTFAVVLILWDTVVYCLDRDPYE